MSKKKLKIDVALLTTENQRLRNELINIKRLGYESGDHTAEAISIANAALSPYINRSEENKVLTFEDI